MIKPNTMMTAHRRLLNALDMWHAANLRDQRRRMALANYALTTYLDREAQEEDRAWVKSQLAACFAGLNPQKP